MRPDWIAPQALQNTLPHPGGGQTLRRWRALARHTGDHTVAGRMIEAHHDAMAILADLDQPQLQGHGQLWGVWAAQPPQPALRAVRNGPDWQLHGTKPWCSGASTCTHALVTAKTPDDDGESVELFAVALNHDGVVPVPGTWNAVGMSESDSGWVEFSDVPATWIGTHRDYLDRPGFWHGGIGVAACWFGATRAVAAPLFRAAAAESPSPFVAAHAGAVAAELASGWALLKDTAWHIDADPDDETGTAAARAFLVRTRIDHLATTVIERVGRALGAGPLCQDAEHARRVADLGTYIRQTHAEKDEAGIPAALGSAAASPLGWDALMGTDFTSQPDTPEPTRRADAWFNGAQSPALEAEELDDYTASLPRWQSWTQDHDGKWSLSGAEALLVIAPHPDDEILGAGTLLAGAIRAHIPVTILAVTDGTGSHADTTIPPARLAAQRTTESEHALAHLMSLGAHISPAGAQKSSGNPDAPTTPETLVDRRRLRIKDGSVEAEEGTLITHIRGVLDSMPQATMVAAPVENDGHPDHNACGRAAAEAARTHGFARLVGYPVWLWHHSTPETTSTTQWETARSLELDEQLQQVRDQALDCFVSQLTVEYGQPQDRAPGEPIITEAIRSTMLRPQQVVFPQPVPLADFHAKYREDPDPWNLAERWYEQRKYAITLGMLPRERYRRGYEPGCSVGVLTSALATRCEELIATDIVPEALEAARRRLHSAHPDLAGRVDFRLTGVQQWPAGEFDLIMISELAYYLPEEDFQLMIARARESLSTDGVLVAAHWHRGIDDGFRDAESVHEQLASVPAWDVLASYRDADVLIDVYGPPGPSVADADGAGIR